MWKILTVAVIPDQLLNNRVWSALILQYHSDNLRQPFLDAMGNITYPYTNTLHTNIYLCEGTIN